MWCFCTNRVVTRYSIKKIAHILPTYWYIQNNEIVKKLETINFETLKPIIVNMGSSSNIFNYIYNINKYHIKKEKEKLHKLNKML